MIGDAWATLQGSIVTNPQEDIISYGFCWSQDPNPTIADNSNNFGPTTTTDADVQFDISGLLYSLGPGTVDGPSREKYYIRTYTQYDSSGSSIIIDYSGVDISFNTADLSGVIATAVATDPSYTISNFTIDITDNPPYPENNPGTITSWGIIWEISGNYHDNSGNESILNISFNDGSHEFGAIGITDEIIDSSMVSHGVIMTPVALILQHGIFLIILGQMLVIISSICHAM